MPLVQPTLSPMHNLRTALPLDFNMNDFLQGSLAATEETQFHQQDPTYAISYPPSHPIPTLRPEESTPQVSHPTNATIDVHGYNTNASGHDPTLQTALDMPSSSQIFSQTAAAFLNSIQYPPSPLQPIGQPVVALPDQPLLAQEGSAAQGRKEDNSTARDSLDAAKNLLQAPISDAAFDPKELLVRISLKLFNVHPHELPPLVLNMLREMVTLTETHSLSNARPGCTHLTLDILMSKKDANAFWMDGAEKVLQSFMSPEMLQLLPRQTFNDVPNSRDSSPSTMEERHQNTMEERRRTNSVTSVHSTTSTTSNSTTSSISGRRGKVVAQINGSVAVATGPTPRDILPMDLPDTLPWPPKLHTVLPLAMTPEIATTMGIFLLGSNISDGHDMIVVRNGEYTPNLEVFSSGKLDDLTIDHPEFGRPLIKTWKHSTAAVADITTTSNSDSSSSGGDTANGEYVHLVLRQCGTGLHSIEAQRGSILSNPLGILVLEDKHAVSELRELEVDDAGVADVAQFVRSIGIVLDYLEKKAVHAGSTIDATTNIDANLDIDRQISSLAVSIARLCVARRWPSTLKLVLPAVVPLTDDCPATDTSEMINPFASAFVNQLSILHIAAASRSTATVPLLREWSIANKCPFECQKSGAWGLTPLHVAALLDDDADMAMQLTGLYKKGAALWYQSMTRDGLSPAMIASIASNTAVLNWLSDQLPEVKECWTVDEKEQEELEGSGSSDAELDAVAAVMMSASAAKAWYDKRRSKGSCRVIDGEVLSFTLDGVSEKQVKLFKGITGAIWPYPMRDDGLIVVAAAGERSTLKTANVVNFGVVLMLLVLMMAYALRLTLPSDGFLL